MNFMHIKYETALHRQFYCVCV